MEIPNSFNLKPLKKSKKEKLYLNKKNKINLKLSMIVFLLGPPCSGKGTQGRILSKTTNIAFYSAGDIVRETFPNGTKERDLINQGLFLSGEKINKAIEQTILKHPKIILDGYPRTLDQLEFVKNRFENRTKLAIILVVDDNILINRMLTRYFCKFCQITHKNQVVCCNSLTLKREDDQIEKLKLRIDLYKKYIKDIKIHFNEIFYVNANETEENVHLQIYSYIKKKFLDS